MCKLMAVMLACMLTLTPSAEGAALENMFPEAEIVFMDELGYTAIDKSDVEMLAKLVWGEARGVSSKAEQAAVIWCVLNRVDAGWGSIQEVITAPRQFTGYRRSNPVTPELYELSLDVLVRWEAEKRGAEDAGRTLPKEYLYFSGVGGRNRFRTGCRSGAVWDWRMADPYDK